MKRYSEHPEHAGRFLTDRDDLCLWERVGKQLQRIDPMRQLRISRRSITPRFPSPERMELHRVPQQGVVGHAKSIKRFPDNRRAWLRKRELANGQSVRDRIDPGNGAFQEKALTGECDA